MPAQAKRMPIRKQPSPPAGLSKAARDLWQQLFDDSENMDAQAQLLLGLMVEQWQRLQEAREILKAQGLQLAETTGAGHTKFKANPMIRTERDCIINIARLWRELGYGELPPQLR